MTQKFKILGQPDTYYSIPPVVAPPEVWYDITDINNWQTTRRDGHPVEAYFVGYTLGVGYTFSNMYQTSNSLKFFISDDYAGNVSMLWAGVRPTKIRITTDASLVEINTELSTPLISVPLISGVPVTFTLDSDFKTLNIGGGWTIISKIEINAPLNSTPF